MPPRWTRRWKRAFARLFPLLVTECPSGTYHWFFERWCLCEYRGTPGGDISGEDATGGDAFCGNGALGRDSPHDSKHDGVFDLKRWEKARQGPEGYRPGNTDVQIGDYVQPVGLGLRPPLSWKVVGFEARGGNPKYRVILEYPLSGDRLSLENLPCNTRPPGDTNDPGHLDELSTICERRSAA